LILGLIAQAKVKSAYAQCSRIPAKCGLTASQMVADLLRRNGNTRVRVGHVSGELTDHYDPSKEVLNLSDGVYSSNSIAAMGIAAHEAGHAMQKLENYAPLNLRSAIVPAVNICSSLSTPMFILGLIFAWQPLVYIGIGLFAASTVFALVTLPVEFDASKRAIQMLSEGGYSFRRGGRGGMVRKVLSAAALTYVAAAVTSLLSLLRLILIAKRNDRQLIFAEKQIAFLVTQGFRLCGGDQRAFRSPFGNLRFAPMLVDFYWKFLVCVLFVH